MRVSRACVAYALCPFQAKKCLEHINEALSSGTFTQSDASKLAGRLSWATQFLFRKLGRAMLRPLFSRKYSSETGVDEELRLALRWWQRVLSKAIAETYPWKREQLPPAVVLVDARGAPARCAAVLMVDGAIHYTDGPPADELMAMLKDRSDNKIGGRCPFLPPVACLFSSAIPCVQGRWKRLPSRWACAPSSHCSWGGTLCSSETTQGQR